jgi:hypothetical protein
VNQAVKSFPHEMPILATWPRNRISGNYTGATVRQRKFPEIPHNVQDGQYEAAKEVTSV